MAKVDYLQTKPPGLARHVATLNAIERAMCAGDCYDNLDDALRSILDASSEALGCAYSGLMAMDLRDGELSGRLVLPQQTANSLRRAGLEVPDEQRLCRLDMTRNLVARVFLEQRLQVVSCLTDLEGPHWDTLAAHLAQANLGITAIALAPMVVGGECLGVVAAAFDKTQEIADWHLTVLRLCARCAADIIKYADLSRTLVDRERQVSHLLGVTIDAQEGERERICLEIHDGVTQALAAAHHYLQVVDIYPQLPEGVRPHVQRAGTLVRTAIREAREVIATLRPAALDTLGLVGTLRDEMGDLRAQTGLQIEFEADDVHFAKATETALYRIVREAVTNVTKHAHASRVTMLVRQTRERIIVEVQDDGIGFDPAAEARQPTPQKVGLLSMRKRAELLGGALTLTSRPAEGTLVRVEVPLPAPVSPAAERIGVFAAAREAV
ncbi:MAG: sensor histidine kinase [Chloroflexota bacterium]